MDFIKAGRAHRDPAAPGSGGDHQRGGVSKDSTASDVRSARPAEPQQEEEEMEREEELDEEDEEPSPPITGVVYSITGLPWRSVISKLWLSLICE